MTINTWHKHPTQKGVLVRTIAPDTAAPATPRAQVARWRALEAPLPKMDWPAIERVYRDSPAGLGGSIADVLSTRETLMPMDGVLVAGREVVVYIEFDPEDGHAVSDAIKLTLYRNPSNPRQILGTF